MTKKSCSMLHTYLDAQRKVTPFELLRNLNRELRALEAGTCHVIRGYEPAMERLRTFNLNDLEFPHIGIFDRGDDYLVVFELPNCPKEAISLTATKTSVTVSARIQCEWVDNQTHSLNRTDIKRSFTKTVRFDAEILPERIEAEFHHDVLELHVPKRAMVGEKRVKVEID